MLVPILTAESVTPGMQVQAALGFASVATSLAAMAAAEAQQKDFSNQLRGLNMSLHGIQSLLGSFHF